MGGRYELDLLSDWQDGFYTAGPKEGWRPASREVPLDERLPLPWPPKYLEIWRQPFAPSAFFGNAVRIANYSPRDSTEADAIRALAADLCDRLAEFTKPTVRGRFVVYRFKRSYHRRPIVPPWVSAYGNAAALIGLCRLAEWSDDSRYRLLADEIFEPFTHVADPATDDGFWISCLDADGFRWFEEQPLPGCAEQPRILNGHIRAINALCHYARLTDRAEPRDLIQGGLCTVHRYAREYRRPGQVNSYDLLYPDWPDYGPQRTVVQQRCLHRLTGHPFFAEMASLFEADNDAAAKSAR